MEWVGCMTASISLCNVGDKKNSFFGIIMDISVHILYQIEVL